MSPVRRSDVAAGKRDRLVSLVPIVQSRAASGFPTEAQDPPTIDLWVSKEDISGRERIVMNQASAPFDTRFVLPFGDAFNPDTIDVPKVFELEYLGKRYDITAAAEIGRREGVEVLTLARRG